MMVISRLEKNLVMSADEVGLKFRHGICRLGGWTHRTLEQEDLKLKLSNDDRRAVLSLRKGLTMAGDVLRCGGKSRVWPKLLSFKLYCAPNHSALV